MSQSLSSSHMPARMEDFEWGGEVEPGVALAEGTPSAAAVSSI